MAGGPTFYGCAIHMASVSSFEPFRTRYRPERGFSLRLTTWQAYRRGMRFMLLALLVAAAGCSKKEKADPGPPCDQVVDHMLVVMKQGLTGHDDLALGNKKQMVEQCESRKLSAKERRCLLEAKDLAGLASCRDAKAPEPAPTRPLPTGSATGSGS